MLGQRHFDVCVVGSGVAGALVAAVAARNKQRVVVVEAGQRFDFADRLNQLRRHEVLKAPLWQWELPERDRFVDSSSQDLGYPYPLNGARIKAVGGSTLHWGGLAQRMFESDFRSATRYGTGLDWPITYDDLEPYYVRAERELGVSGTPNPTDPPRSAPFPMPGFPPRHEEQAWMKVAEDLGIEVGTVSHARNSIPYAGRSPCVAYSFCKICPSGARYSADFHIKEAEGTGYCTVLDRTVARRIELTGSGNVNAVQASTWDGTEYEIHAHDFVIAAHAIESARLLLLSGVGNHSDLVGRNLMEHWYLSAGGFVQDKVFPKRIGFNTLECNHFYDGVERQHRGAIKLEFKQKRDPLDFADKLGKWGKELAQYDCDTFGHWVGIGAEVEHQPNPHSRMTLDEGQRDLFGDPVPRIHFALNEMDRLTSQRAEEIVTMLLDARGAQDIAVDKRFDYGAHHMGTCRMSDNPDGGVVDQNCQVFGTNNLFVVGSSVFPTSGARQPTLTIAALSLRLAEHLLEKQRNAKIP